MSLSVVAVNDTFTGRPFRLLVLSTDSLVRAITAVERDIEIPLISLALHQFYTLRADMTARPPRISAVLSVLWRGVRREVLGAVVPLVTGPDLIVPMGTFE